MTFAYLTFLARPLRRALLASAVLLAAATLAACDSVEDRVAAHQKAGMAYLEQNEPGKALIEFEGALKLDVNFAPAYFQIARIMEIRGDRMGAYARYLKVVELDPDNLEARVKIGQVKVIAGDLDGAQAEIDKVLEAAPNNAEALALAAGIKLRQDDLEAARPLIDRALAAAPDNLTALSVDLAWLAKSGDVPGAISRAEEAIALHPKDLSAHLSKLSLLERSGDQKAVGVQLKRMVETFPAELGLREALTTWAVREGDVETAEAQLRALADAEPGKTARVADLVKLVAAARGVDAARAEIEARAAAAPGDAALALLLTDFEIEAGNRDRAVEILRGLAAGAGETAVTARARLARLYMAEGDRAAADAEIDAVLAADPRNLTAMKLRIGQLIDRQELDAAIGMIRAALEEAPEDAELLQLDGRAQEMTGNLDLASDRLAKAVRASEYAPEVVLRYVEFLQRANRVSGAETVLAEAVSRHPKDQRLLELLAATRVELEDWPGAERAIGALALVDADRARQLRAAALIRQQRFEESGALLGDDEAAVTQRVQSWLGAGKPEEAAAYLDGLIAGNPKNLQALGLRGAVHAAQGETAAAEARYRDVLALNPGNPAAVIALANIVATRDGLAAGEAAIREGLAVAPDSPGLLEQLAQYREAQGDVDGAIDLYESVYRMAPDALVSANNLANLLADHRANDPEALRRAYVIASRLENSPSPAFRDTFAWTRYLNGEFETARAAIGPVVEQAPGNPWIRYHAGLIHLAMNEPEAARAHFEAALKAAGDAPFGPRADIEARLAALTPG